MFVVIRIFIGGIFLAISIAIIKRKIKTKKNILYFLSAFITTALITILAFCPFENLFINFDSPKAAYEYYTFEKSNIVLIVEGNECDLIINRKDIAHYVYHMIPKTEKGWKIGIGTNDKLIYKTYTNGILILINQYKNTKDFFITVYNTQGKEIDITDIFNTEFQVLKETIDPPENTFVSYYAYIPDFNEQYELTVNGISIKTNHT